MNNSSPGGRHAAAAGGGLSRGRLIAVAAVVIVLALVGYGAWTLGHRGGSSPGRAAGSASTGAPATATTTPAGHDPSGTASASPGATGDALLAACRSEVAAGDALAEDAVPIATDWREHTSAQTDFDLGIISAKKAESIWDRTKKPGPADVAKYAADQATYQKAAGACAKLGSPAGAAAACQQRAAANAKIADASAPVEADWATHIQQMKTKKSMWTTTKGYDSYMGAWMTLVDRAPGRLAAYDNAVKDAQSAPTCS